MKAANLALFIPFSLRRILGFIAAKSAEWVGHCLSV